MLAYFPGPLSSLVLWSVDDPTTAGIDGWVHPPESRVGPPNGSFTRPQPLLKLWSCKKKNGATTIFYAHHYGRPFLFELSHITKHLSMRYKPTRWRFPTAFRGCRR